MSIDGFLTFLGLIAALIALAAEATRRSLFVRWRLNLVVSAAAFGLVLYLLLFDLAAPACPLGAVCAVLELGEERWIDPNDAAFLVVLVWFVVIAGGLAWRRALGARHLGSLAALARAFTAEKRYLELSHLLEPHLELIARLAADHEPRRRKAHEAARALQRLLFEQRDLGVFIALERPALAVAMMRQRHHRVFGFSDRTLALLTERPDSPLFAEIENNQTVTAAHGYTIRPENTYLAYLFGDARHAEQLMAWQPVMDSALERLEAARGEAYARFLNGKPVRFEEQCWRDPTFIAIRYLDLMVDAALRQDVASHMWLFYLPRLADHLIALHDDGAEGIDPDSEAPTRGGYLLMSLVKTMRDWIEAVKHLPEGAHHLGIDTPRAAPQADNIPKSAILALGDVSADLLVAPNLGEGFRRHLLEVVFRLVKDLPRDGDRSMARQALIQSLVHGGQNHRHDHLMELRGLLTQEDAELRMRLDDLAETIEWRIDHLAGARAGG